MNTSSSTAPIAGAAAKAGSAILARSLAFLLSLALASASASASASATDDPAACRAIEAPMARLDCYDRAVDAARRTEQPDADRRPAHAAAAPAAQRAAGAERNRAPENGPEASARGAPESALAGPPGSRAAPAASAAAPAERAAAGQAAREQATARASDDAATRIVEVRQTTLGRHRYVLDDGAVWEQAELRSGAALAAGDRVVLQETLFGGHRLRPVDGRGASVKVRPPQ